MNTQSLKSTSFSHELIIIAHYVDTYTTALIEQKISFVLSFGHRGLEQLLGEDYSYEKLVDCLTRHSIVDLKGQFDLKHASYLMSLGLCKEERILGCLLRSEIELETFHAQVILSCSQNFKDILSPVKVLFDPSKEVRNYAIRYLDELMALIGDKLVYTIHPIPRELAEYNIVHFIIKKEDAGLLSPLKLDLEETGLYTQLSTAINTRDFELDIIVLLV